MKKKIYVVAIILALTLLLCSTVGCTLKDDTQKYYIEIGQVEDSRVASIVANNTIPSCVRITAEFPSISRTSKSSGFFISSNGYIITNRHCVVRSKNGTDLPSDKSDALEAQLKVTDTSGYTYTAKLVDYSTSADIALIRIIPPLLDVIIDKEFAPLTFDTVSTPYYGDRLYTVGNPEDMGFIFSELMVASPAIKLSSKDAHSSIILDGNINHGNSGSPLIDVNSHVVGLVFARVESSDNSLNIAPAEKPSSTYGLGCAIPAKVVTDFLDECNVVDYLTYTPTPSGDASES